jgi:hypothetical protein
MRGMAPFVKQKFLAVFVMFTAPHHNKHPADDAIPVDVTEPSMRGRPIAIFGKLLFIPIFVCPQSAPDLSKKILCSASFFLR